MFEKSKIFYENSKNQRIEFSLTSPFKLFIDGVDGLSTNDVGISESSIVGQIGTVVESLQINSKQLTLNGEITEDLENNRKKMIFIIYPGDKGKLIFEKNDTEYYLDIIPKTTPIISNHEDIEQFQFAVLAPYPFWKNNKGENVVKFGSYLSQYKYPQSFSKEIYWKISDKVDSTIKNVYNAFPYDLGFTIQFKCKDNVKNPFVINTITQEKILLNPNLMSIANTTNYVFRVSTIDNQKYVKIIHPDGQESSGISCLTFDSSFFKLHPEDNPLRFGAEANEKALEVTLVYDEVLVGI